MFYNSPFYTDKENLEIILGEVKFRDNVIKNLRRQIDALRKSLMNYGMNPSSIDNVQFAHQRQQNEIL